MLGIFLDIETTGLNPQKHRAIEIAIKVIDLFTGVEKNSYESIIYQPKEIWDKCDPNSLLINGFSWGKLLSGQSESTVAEQIILFLNNLNIQRGMAVFICQNPSFDRAFFTQLIDVDIQEQHKWPYHWLDFASMYWAIYIKETVEEGVFSSNINLSKDNIAKKYGLPPETSPHRAMNGVDHLVLCYKTAIGYPALITH
jgi:DNA polymerase-3 subunit epsilon/oligoribonuclease